jgi:hypothetical protein
VSFITEKWTVFTPEVEGSVLVFEAGISSARRKPVCTFVAEGVNMDLSLMVTSIALVPFASNFFESAHHSVRSLRGSYK